jgi:23S rRNA pseudouridine955/2504/2580 synthase
VDYSGPAARRLCLHAARLQVPGYPEFVAPLPEDISALVAQLRQGRGQPGR